MPRCTRCWPRGTRSGRSRGIWAGDGTPCSAMRAPRPGRNWSTGAGRHRAPACWTPSNRTGTSVWTKAAATSPSCSGRSAHWVTPAATPTSAITWPDTVRPRRRWPRLHRPSARSPAGSPAIPTPSPRTNGPQLKALLERCPELAAADQHVRVFAAMLTQLTGHDLPQWISDTHSAGLSGISSFAKGLEQDLDAVTAGLTSRWNSGPVEGRVNHIKMIKRQMFGRAGLPLLRKRVLLTAAGHALIARNGVGLGPSQRADHGL
ncbi:transposase [Streptosporangium soli]